MSDWRNRLDMIVNKVKAQLFAKGVDNMEQLKDVFLTFDKDQNGTLSKLEFEEFFSKLGIFLARQELRTVYDHFDTNRDGQITYSEFVNVLKTCMSENRLQMVKHAWSKLAGGCDSCTFESLVSRYNAPAHPRVTSREKKAETVFNDFVTIFGAHACDGNVSCDEFAAYYSEINAVMPAEKENYFVDMLLKTWGLDSDCTAVSESRLSELEGIVFEKVRQRTHGAEDEGRTIKKIFKHFDLDGMGTIEPNEFRKSLETLGCTFKDFEMDAMFRRFDKDGNGRLDYEEFASMFAIRGSGNNPNVNPSFGIEREPPYQILTKIRETCKARGNSGIRGLGNVFRRMDNNGNKRFERTEFMWGLRENGHKLSPSEFERVFKYFDKNSNGSINYDEFLRGIRGPMNEFRQGFVKQAFACLDKDGSGVVELNDISAIFDGSCHPDVVAGRKTSEEILTLFMAQWDTVQKDGRIHYAEFLEYFEDISCSVDEDEYFEAMMRSAWKLQ